MDLDLSLLDLTVKPFGFTVTVHQSSLPCSPVSVSTRRFAACSGDNHSLISMFGSFLPSLGLVCAPRRYTEPDRATDNLLPSQ